MAPLFLGHLPRLSYVLTFPSASLPDPPPCQHSWPPSSLPPSLILNCHKLSSSSSSFFSSSILTCHKCSSSSSTAAPHSPSLLLTSLLSQTSYRLQSLKISQPNISRAFLKRNEPFSTSTFFHPPLECDHLRPPSIRSSFTHKAALLFCLVTIATIFTNSLRPTAFVRTLVMEHFQRSV